MSTCLGDDLGHVHFNSVEMTPYNTYFAKNKVKVIIFVSVHMYFYMYIDTKYITFVFIFAKLLFYRLFPTDTQYSSPFPIGIYQNEIQDFFKFSRKSGNPDDRVNI